jgi:hypothetical protein
MNPFIHFAISVECHPDPERSRRGGICGVWAARCTKFLILARVTSRDFARDPMEHRSPSRGELFAVMAFTVLLNIAASRQVPATISPPRPTVGDPITLTFPAPIRVAASPDFELIEAKGNRVVVRSFRTGPFTIMGKLVRGPRMTDVAARVHVFSVLQPNDSLEPAELKPPRPLPPNPVARGAIIAALIAAVLSWAAVYLLARRGVAVEESVLGAVEEFHQRLRRAAHLREPAAKLIALADATRIFLSRTSPAYRRELTTFELLRILPPGDVSGMVREVLTASDLAKFSPWGVEGRDYGHMLERLRRLPQYFEADMEQAA